MVCPARPMMHNQQVHIFFKKRNRNVINNLHMQSEVACETNKFSGVDTIINLTITIIVHHVWHHSS